MNFKTSNWKQVRDAGLKHRVQYLYSKIELPLSGKAVYDAPTVVVALWADKVRYVGVAQCSPKDQYSPEKGREIAAGRALKALRQCTMNPDREPNEVFVCENDEVDVYGLIPDHMVDLINDSILFENSEKR